MVGDDVLQAIVRLSNDPDFQVFLEEVVRRKEAARDELEASTDPWLAGRAQGRSIFAAEILSLARDARSAIAKRQAVRQGASR